MDKYDQLEKIKQLLDDGAMTQAEYDLEKSRILSGQASNSSQFWGMQEQEYCMFMHLSQFLGFVLPFAGLVIPIVMWATAKEYSNAVDNQGRIIFNWILSSIIYLIICLILLLVLIGFPLLFALFIVDIVFVIMGAIKARNGVEWEYPLSIPFFRRSETDSLEV